MKTSIHLGILIVTSLLLIQGCGISRSAAEKEQIAADIENAVIESEFTFNATYAFPTVSNRGISHHTTKLMFRQIP